MGESNPENAAMKEYFAYSELERELLFWKQYAAYCFVCAQEGERNPQTFEVFKEQAKQWRDAVLNRC